MTWRCVGKNNGGKCDCKDAHNEELFAALQSIFGSEDADLRCVKRIQMHDEKLVFEMNNGRKETWRRT